MKMSKGTKFTLFTLFALGFVFLIGLGIWHNSKESASDYVFRIGDAADTQFAPVPPSPKQLKLSYGFSKGVLFNHEFSLTNTSGEDLSEVHLTVTFVGEDASPKIERYWSSWPLGAKQETSISTNRVSNVQRIEVRGNAKEGVVRADFTPPE